MISYICFAIFDIRVFITLEKFRIMESLENDLFGFFFKTIQVTFYCGQVSYICFNNNTSYHLSIKNFITFYFARRAFSIFKGEISFSFSRKQNLDCGSKNYGLLQNPKCTFGWLFNCKSISGFNQNKSEDV